MYELDHMLNGQASSQHLQELIQLAERERMARSVKPDQQKRKAVSPLRTIYAAIMHIISAI